jgi:hypothetical protein
LAEPTLDSANPPSTAVPPTGPGSKSPIDPMKGNAPTPIGGGKAPSPMGAPGRPQNEVVGLKPEDREAIEFLLEEINSITDTGEKDNKIIINELLNRGWSEKRLKGLSRLFEQSLKDFLENLISLIVEHGIDRASDIIDKKLDKVEIKKYKITKRREDTKKKYLGDEAVEVPPLGGEAPPMMPPPLGGPPKLSSSNDLKRPDVNLYNNILRGGQMAKKLMIKGGALVEASTDPKAIVNNLLSLKRKAKAYVASIEDLKIKYAGVQVIRKKAIDDMMGGMGGGMGGMDAPGGMDKPMDDESLPMGPEEDEKGDAVLDEIKETVESIDEKVEEIAESVGAGEKVLDEGLEEEGEEGEEEESMKDLDDEIAEAKELIPVLKKASKEAKKFVETVKSAGFPFEKKEDKKEEKKDEKKEEKDEKKEDKKEEKKDEKKDEKKSITKEELVKRVEARLKEIRAEKEAQATYPWKKEVKPIPKVDNINAETAKNQISTADKEIKGQPAKDKGYETINPSEAQADLSYKTDKGTAGQKKVSVEVAERIRKHSMEDVASKARCAVELAAQQQLKGLIDDPLKVAFLNNMKEAGINEDLAKIIVHNAYIDGYEGSHKAIMEEAFETFMNKDIDDFVKVAKFVKDYKVADNNSVENVTSEEPESREKSASTVPIRGSKVTSDRREDYKKYWNDVERDRRGF